MRIGIFTDHFYPELGGIQDSVAELARELGRRGHKVDIWAPRPSKENFIFVGLPFREIDLGENVHIRRVFSFGFPSSSLQSRVATPFFSIGTATYDVIHVHSFICIGFRGMRVAKRSRTPLIGTDHWAIAEFADCIHWFFEQVFRRATVWWVTWFYNRFDFITAPSTFVLTKKEAGGFIKPYTAVSNPIDTDTFTPAAQGEREYARKKFGLDGKVVACVGRIAPEKKNDVVLRAFAELLRKVPDAMLAFGGHGSFEGEMKVLARELGVRDRVRFLGTLTKQEVAELYHASDVYAIASVSETQSMSLIQAFAAGLSAVGVRWGAIPEYLNAERGFLFERDDHHQMAKQLEVLLTDDKKRRRFGANAAAFARKFSVQAVVSEWEKIYTKVVDTR